jgi:hypothetical protein
MKRFTTAWLLLVVAAPVAAAEAAARPITVPFELIRSKHIAVQVKINGKGPYRVIFDTGAPVTLLNNKVAKASGVLPPNFRPSPFSLFGSAGQFTIRSLEVGEVKATNVSTIVMDHPTVNLISKVLGPIEGLVGFPFFARYAMTIDYQAKTLTFVPNGYKPADVMKKIQSVLMDRGKPKPKVLAPAAQWGFRVRKAGGDEEAGVTVEKVLAGSAAALGGLKAGDRLLTLDGRWTDTVADCYLAATHVKAGTAARLVVKRQGKEVELTVKPVAGL